MKSKIFTFAAVMSVICFAANQCVWTGSGTGGWSDAANWKDGLVPVAGDTVQAEGENSITIGDDDVALASSIATINIVGASSSAVIDISGDAELKCQIKGDGCIVKRGAGSVIIAASLTEYDYYTTKGVRIEEGFFGFPCTEYPIGGDRGTVRLGPVYVAKGAFFGTHACPEKSSNTIIESLEGEGVVTNTTTAAGPYQLRINGNTNKIFDGQINGNIRIYSAGTYVLRGTASSMKGSSMLNGATCSVYSFGVVNGPSSIGQNFEVWSREAGGEYIYCGEGETTDKIFCFYDAQCKNKGHIINGGSNGGLIWKGEFTDRRTTDAGWCDRLILSGDNRVPCEITGPFTEGSGRTFSSITKKGTGTWILRHHASRNNHGVICVDNGTLQFESIAETNNVCSLGLSTGWYSNTYTGATNDDKTVHYAIRLGDSGTTGTLEYIGAERTYCSTRPIAVKGRGKIKIAEGAGDMSLTGFCTADSSGGTLVVDIPDGNSVSLTGIADGKGVLSLEKTGAGKLNLRRDSSFTGAIAVKEGSVKIFDTRYRWYRFTVMDKYPRQPTDTGFDNNVTIQEFALYDDDGTCHTDGMKFIVTYKPEEVSGAATPSVKNYYTALEENSATWAMNGESYNYYTERDGDKLFDNRSNNNGCCVNFGVMDFSDPETWVKFVIRVGEDVPEITSYDFVF
jgi:autotransporter-associated beta strand protein